MNEIIEDGIFFCGYCPVCKKGRAKIIRTNRPIQEAKCNKCGAKWKICSVNLYYEDALQMASDIEKKAREVGRKYDFFLY